MLFNFNDKERKSNRILRKPLRYNEQLNQSGRSMVEMLGVLAVVGILSIGGVTGYSYATDKMKANKIMQDVELVYVSATSQSNREYGTLNEVPFITSSGYPTYTELLFDTDKNIDIVLVKSVPKSVCELVLDMVQNSNWIVSSVETDTNYLYRIEECTEQNAMVFSLSEVDGFAYECNKECPENRMCNVNDECVCAYGYIPDINGECQEIQCNETTEVTCTLDRGEKWCCPHDTFCGENMGQCVPFEGFCVYRFNTAIEGLQNTTDCSYKVTGAYPNTTVIPDQECADPNHYCLLLWTKDSWNGNDTEPTPSFSHSGILYGVCQRLISHDISPIQKVPEGNYAFYQIEKDCPEKQYCSLAWDNDSCNNIPIGSSGKALYGICLDMNKATASCPITAE